MNIISISEKSQPDPMENLVTVGDSNKSKPSSPSLHQAIKPRDISFTSQKRDKEILIQKPNKNKLLSIKVNKLRN